MGNKYEETIELVKNKIALYKDRISYTKEDEKVHTFTCRLVTRLEAETWLPHYKRILEVLERDEEERPERIHEIAEAYGGYRDYSYFEPSISNKICKKLDEAYEKISKKNK